MSPSVVFSTEALIFSHHRLVCRRRQPSSSALLRRRARHASRLRSVRLWRQRDALGGLSRIRDTLKGSFSPTLAVVPSSLTRCFIGQKPGSNRSASDLRRCRSTRSATVPSWIESIETLSLELVPRILLKLLVTQRQATVLLVDFEHYDLQVGADLSVNSRRMLDLLGPGQVGDMHQTVDALLDFDARRRSRWSCAPWPRSACRPGYFCSISADGSVVSCLMPSDILRSARSSVRMTASTSSPTFMNSCAERRRRQSTTSPEHVDQALYARRRSSTNAP